MHCRYCGGLYAANERACGGCGAPKTMVQTLLDVPAAPDHWTRSMIRTAQRVLIVSAGLVALGAGLAALGYENLGFGLAFFWIFPIAPGVLLFGAWRSSEGNLGERVQYIGLAVLLWIGIVFAALVAISPALPPSPPSTSADLYDPFNV